MRDYAELQKDLSCCAAEYTACMKCKHWGKSTCSNELCGKAADAIEELLAAVPRWISVEERLPDYGEIILCYNRKTDQYELGSRHGDRTMYLFGYGMVGMGDRDFPTHWMLLPAPPKEDADAKT